MTNSNGEGGTDLNLSHIVRPAHADAGEDEASPGLLLLHGRGADEEDLMGLEQALDPRLTIVSARAPYRLGPGFAWYGMYEIGRPDNDTLLASLLELQAFIRGLPAAHNIDPQRLYLMGFSQGAVMSAALALTVPEQVRGVIMHSGYVPTEAALDLQTAGIKDKPFFLAHGKYDDVIPVTFGRDAEEYLSEAGARLTYREYPIGHTISEESLYDLSEWLTRELDGG
ncbi:MAG TPA: alpha/beta hydrolase [Chloroflexia bacterium]|jgi:phospholipase/carboxylesterase